MYNELTENDIKKMEEEIEQRKLVTRKEALEAVKEARAHGDLSDNFEYYVAKKEKNINESRISYLERMIRTAVMISDSSKESEAGLNNTVEIFFEEDQLTEKYKLTTTIKGDSLKGMISTQSPLGKAILGSSVNDRIFVKVSEEYGYYIVIKAIDKTTSDESDRLRNF